MLRTIQNANAMTLAE